ncbi:alpha/beta fold hydrolase [Halobacterium rubrum]|uniref:alpha/beta fold hydrolase n=1 Tax=Halobacterium TaxID=2239 RepID=UPI001F1C48E6|nr:MULTISPECIES: alpha/beta hydrolase [Halobacterium]MDH5018906.1 alpha/beta hydrolase [Halobacterium rubrum]
MPRVETNGVDTYYERHGDGHPLVFIHGSGWDHRQWRPQVETLTDDFEAITYDVRGHGKTGGSDQTDISYATYTADLEALLDALDVARPVLVGLSMGGRIAHRYAAAHPETLTAVVSYEAPVRLEPLSLSLPLRVLDRIHRGVLRFLGPYRAYKLFSWFQKRRLDIEDSDTEPTHIRGLGMTKEEYVRDAVRQVDRSEKLKLRKSFADTIDTPGEVSVPTLVLTGDGPDSFNHDSAATLVEEIPDARRETIPGAGHAGNIDNPEAFDEALREFLADVDAVATTSPPPQGK